MLVYLLWSLDGRAAASGHGWLESARRANLASLVASHQAPEAARAGHGTDSAAAADSGSAPAAVSWDGRRGIDDDEHLAAYNAFLARLNQAETGRKE
jgi:hypothetical protein